MKIIVDKQLIYAYHGVMPQERETGAYFLVSTEVEVEDSKAIDTDELSDTISYADIANVVAAEMAIPSKLLEHVAGRIGHRLLSEHSQIQTATITLIKENPPLGIECKGTGVELKFRR